MAIKTLREMQAADATEIFGADGITISVTCTPASGSAITCNAVYRYLGSEPVEARDGRQVDHLAQLTVLESSWSAPKVDDHVTADGITWTVQAVLRRQAGRRKLMLVYREPREKGMGRRQGGLD